MTRSATTLQEFLPRAFSSLNTATARFAPGRILPAALAVVATPILARLLSTDDFGRLALLQSAALLSASVIFGWVEVVIVRLFAGADQITGQALSPLTIPALAGVVVVGVAGFVASLVTGSVLALLTACGAVAYASTLAATAMARAARAPGVFTVAAVLGLSSRYVLGIPAVMAGAGLAGIFAAWTLGGLAALLFVGRHLVVRARTTRFSRPRREDLVFGAPMLAIQSGLLGLALADRLLLALSLPASEIAPYALGYSLIDQGAGLAFSILLAAQFPSMLRTYALDGASAASAEFGRALETFATVAIPLLLLLGLFGADLARAVGGDAYRDADFRFIPWVAAALFALGLHQYLTIPLQQRKQTMPWLAAVTAAVLVNVVANLVLIPSMGTQGAGIASLLGYGSLAAILIARVHRLVRFPLGAALRAVAAGAAALIIAWVMRNVPWLLAAAGSALAYAVTFVVAHPLARRHA